MIFTSHLSSIIQSLIFSLNMYSFFFKFIIVFQGETFDCPERVPFRLTQNIVNAMVSKRLSEIKYTWSAS